MSRPIKNRLHNYFYFRSRYHLDAALLCCVPISFFISSSLFGILLILIIGCGTWLIFGLNRSLRYGDFWIGWCSVLLSAYGILHVVLHAMAKGGFASLCLAFPSLLIFTVPFAVGITLVREPLKAMVLGCRLAMMLIIALSAYHLALHADVRAGLGTNPVIAAYFVLIFACVSRFPLQHDSPSWHGFVFFYLGCIGALATGTRALLLFFFVAFALDFLRILYSYFRAQDGAGRKKIAIGVIAITLLLALALSQSLNLTQITDNLLTRLANDQSIQTRFHLWEFGWREFLANPIFGIGQCDIRPSVNQFLVQEMGLNITFKHLHNFFVHELAVYGLIGFVLVMTFHVLLYKRLYPLFASSEQRWAFNLFFVGLLVYGLTGSHLSDERMVAVTALMFGVFIAEGKRRQFKLKLDHALNAEPTAKENT